MSFYVKSRFHDVLEKCMWRTWFDLNMKVWKHEAWAWMYICNDCGAKFASNVKVKVKGAEVVSIMNNMSRSCLLLWRHYTTWDLMMLYEIWTRRINMPMCLNGKEHRYISNWLDCIWFKWCLNWMCLYTYILWNCGILVCLYDQVMMSMVFLYKWCYVLTCLYTYILWSCWISICLYDCNMMS